MDMNNLTEEETVEFGKVIGGLMGLGEGSEKAPRKPCEGLSSAPWRLRRIRSGWTRARSSRWWTDWNRGGRWRC